MGRQQFTMYTSLTFFTSLACQWFTCLLTLVYENTTCFGVSSCRLLSLGEGGGLLHLVCPQPAGWLSRLGLYIPGCLQSVGPCLQCILVGSGACVWAARCPPWSAGGVPGSGPLTGSAVELLVGAREVPAIPMSTIEALGAMCYSMLHRSYQWGRCFYGPVLAVLVLLGGNLALKLVS